MNRTILMVTVIAAAVTATQPNPHAAASRRRAPGPKSGFLRLIP